MSKSKINPIYGQYVKVGMSLYHHTGPIQKEATLEVKAPCCLPVFDVNSWIGRTDIERPRKGLVFQLSEDTLKLRPNCVKCGKPIVREGRAIVKGHRIEKQNFAEITTGHKACMISQLFKIRDSNPMPESTAVKPTVEKTFLPHIYQVAFKQEFGVNQ